MEDYNANLGNISKEIIIVDGFVGGGKSALANLLSSLKGIEHWRISSTMEQVCAMHLSGCISGNSASILLNDLFETTIRDLPLARNCNPNFHDQSGIFRDPRLRYFRRIFRTGRNFDEILGHPLFMTHANTESIELLSQVLKNKLCYFWILRNPSSISLLTHLSNWVPRWEGGEGVGKTFQDVGGTRIPFSLKHLEREYMTTNNIGRAVLLLDANIRNGLQAFSKVAAQENSGVFRLIQFENFVLNTRKYIDDLTAVFGVKEDYLTKITLRREQLPRKQAVEAVTHRDYHKYAIHPKSAGIDKVAEHFSGRIDSFSLEVLGELEGFYASQTQKYDKITNLNN